MTFRPRFRWTAALAAAAAADRPAPDDVLGALDEQIALRNQQRGLTHMGLTVRQHARWLEYCAAINAGIWSPSLAFHRFLADRVDGPSEAMISRAVGIAASRGDGSGYGVNYCHLKEAACK